MLSEFNESDREMFNLQIEDTFESQKTEYREYEMNQRFYVIIMSHIKKIQTNGEGGLVAIVRDMTNEHELEQVKKRLYRKCLSRIAHTDFIITRLYRVDRGWCRH